MPIRQEMSNCVWLNPRECQADPEKKPHSPPIHAVGDCGSENAPNSASELKD